MRSRIIVSCAASVAAGAMVIPAPAAAGGTAFCGPNDKPEPGYQGQTPLADMASGRSQDPYFCGLRIVGHSDVWNRGMNWQLARSQHCAYVATLKAAWLADPEDPVTTREPAGVAVIDASIPTKPQPVGLLREPGALDAVETMDAVDAPGRHVLVASDYSGGVSGTPGPAYLEVYDVSNCAKPKHMVTWQWPANAHDVTLSPDGKRVYGTDTLGGRLYVADITDMANPKLQADVELVLPDENISACHTVEFDQAETRMYCAGQVSDNASNGAGDGPSIWDVSHIAKGGSGNPPFLGEGDVSGQGFHHAVPAVIGGRSYMIAADELSLGACDMAFPRIWDASDERKPKHIADFRLEVQDHCAEADVAQEDRLGNYASHYNSVDQLYAGEETRLGLFSFTGAGFRVVDLRNPTKPREVAYYKPGANPVTTFQPAVHGVASLYFQPALTDACGSRAMYVKETGHIWFNCQSNGFFIAELSPDARAYMGLDRPAAQPASARSCTPVRRLSIRLRRPAGSRVLSARVYLGKRLIETFRTRGRGTLPRVVVDIPRGSPASVRSRVVMRVRDRRGRTRMVTQRGNHRTCR